MQVKELMTTSPKVCSLDDTADDAARIMWECDCGAVPVVDREGRIAGIVTDRDICMAAYLQAAALSELAVSSIMSRDLCTVHADDDLRSAERAMGERQVRRLPVVAEGGNLIGMLSLGDVALGVNVNGSTKPKGERLELLRTIASVSEPRSSRDSTV